MVIPRHYLGPSCDGREEGWCRRGKGLGISQLAYILLQLLASFSTCWRPLDMAAGLGLCSSLLVAGPSLGLFGLHPVTSVSDNVMAYRESRGNRP